MSSDALKIKGIILKTSEYKEKDRMVTILTATEGVISFIAKGVAGKTGRNSFAAVPYILGEFVLTKSHGFYYLREGNVISGNSGIMESLEAMAVAGHISDCVQDSVFQSDNSSLVYELVVYAYYALSQYPESFLLIYSSFNWKLIQLLGLSVRYDYCTHCKNQIELTQIYNLYYSDGTCICADCEKITENNSYCRMDGYAISALNKIFDSPVDRIFRLRLDKALESLTFFTTKYLSNQLEKEIKDPISRMRLPL